MTKKTTNKTNKENLLKTINEGVENALTADNYLNFLKDIAPYVKRYSVNNTILIAIQNPRAKVLKTYGGWKKEGYQVKKGERAIGILAPSTFKVKPENEEDEEKEVLYFKELKVFDISQVEVYDQELASKSKLPEYKEPTKLIGNEAKDLYIKSVNTLKSEYGLDIEEEDIDGANGYYNFVNKYIRIEKKLEYNHKFKTMIHELAHHLYDVNETDKDLSYSEKELKAETTAYIVCYNLGIDSSDYSFEYLASWGKSSENVSEKFLKHYKDITNCVNDILEKIGA